MLMKYKLIAVILMSFILIFPTVSAIPPSAAQTMRLPPNSKYMRLNPIYIRVPHPQFANEQICYTTIAGYNGSNWEPFMSDPLYEDTNGTFVSESNFTAIGGWQDACKIEYHIPISQFSSDMILKWEASFYGADEMEGILLPYDGGTIDIYDFQNNHWVTVNNTTNGTNGTLISDWGYICWPVDYIGNFSQGSGHIVIADYLPTNNITNESGYVRVRFTTNYNEYGHNNYIQIDYLSVISYTLIPIHFERDLKKKLEVVNLEYQAYPNPNPYPPPAELV